MKKYITYFDKIGDINTDEVLNLAKERYKELGLKHVVIASSSGDTAVKALRYFKSEELCIVSSRYGFRSPGKNSLSKKNLGILKKYGVKIVFQTHIFSGIDVAISKINGGISLTQYTANIFKMIGAGFKVCAEITVMAADSGCIPVNQEIISIGGTKGGADTALIIFPVHSANFLDMQFKEIICMPRERMPLT